MALLDLRLSPMVEAPVRSIERVPALFIGLLEEAGKLPALSTCIDRMGRTASERNATLSEVAALTWLVAWDRPKLDAEGFTKPIGIAAYRDAFDYHTASDIREVVHIAGTRRAVYEMMLSLRDSARASQRRLIGCVDIGNLEMAQMLCSMGGSVTRVMFEDIADV